MKKLIKYLFFIILFLGTLSVILLSQPLFQDKLLDRAVARLSSPKSVLPEKDALTGLVCGSRSPLYDPNRAEACILIKAGDDIYIFDTGNGSLKNLTDWNIPWSKIKGIFYTHLHSDHISELNEFHLNTWIQGRRNEKLKIYGPEGVQMLTDGIELAYTKDFIFRNEHHGDFIAPLDIAGFNTQTIDLNNPVLIDDGSLKITAYSVTHDPVDPALGFRIDYKGRSISISGDTTYDENLIKNSNNVDVLFHESMSIELLNILNRVSKETGNIVGEIVTIDVQDYHTPIIEVVKAANKANVGHLIFYHHAPAPRTNLMEKIMYRGVDKIAKNWTASHDGTMAVLPVDSDEIIISLIK